MFYSVLWPPNKSQQKLLCMFAHCARLFSVFLWVFEPFYMLLVNKNIVMNCVPCCSDHKPLHTTSSYQWLTPTSQRGRGQMCTVSIDSQLLKPKGQEVTPFRHSVRFPAQVQVVKQRKEKGVEGCALFNQLLGL